MQGGSAKKENTPKPPKEKTFLKQDFSEKSIGVIHRLSTGYPQLCVITYD
jgi:hypothetical protein